MTYGELEHESVYNDNARAEIERIEMLDDNYKDQIKHYIKYLRHHKRSISFSSITDYYKDLKAHDYLAGTINVRRYAVKNRILYLCDNDKISKEDMSYIYAFFKKLNRDSKTSSSKRGVIIPKIISKQEYKMLIDSECSLRQRMFMKFIWATGCGITELLNIKLKDCRQERNKIYIKIAKGKKERVNYISVELFEEIKSTFNSHIWLFETSKDKSYSRNYISGEITKLGKSILNRQISAQTLRSSRAALLIESTGKITAVAKYLGISNPGYLLRYDLQELTDQELEDFI